MHLACLPFELIEEIVHSAVGPGTGTHTALVCRGVCEDWHTFVHTMPVRAVANRVRYMRAGDVELAPRFPNWTWATDDPCIGYHRPLCDVIHTVDIGRTLTKPTFAQLCTDLTAAPQLQSLALAGVRSSAFLLEPLTQLTHLTLDTLHVGWIDTWLSSMVNLVSLNLDNSSMAHVDAIGELPLLETLSMKRVHRCEDMTGVARAPRLRSVDLRGCPDLINVDGFAFTQCLAHLDLWKCKSLTSIVALEISTSLQTVFTSVRVSHIQQPTLFAVLRSSADLFNTTSAVHGAFMVAQSTEPSTLLPLVPPQ